MRTFLLRFALVKVIVLGTFQRMMANDVATRECLQITQNKCATEAGMTCSMGFRNRLLLFPQSKGTQLLLIAFLLLFKGQAYKVFCLLEICRQKYMTKVKITAKKIRNVVLVHERVDI